MSEAPQKDRSLELHVEHLSSHGEQHPYIQVIAVGPGENTDNAAKARASLFAKLVAVNQAVKKLKQTGKFNAGNTKYDYATEADVIEPIAKALADNGIATVPSVVEQWWHDLPGKYGTNRVVTVHAQLLIGDADEGSYIVAHAFSTAANADKASNAAFTTAIKYLLAKLALVAFGDDADAYTVEGEAADGKAKPKAKAAPKAASATKRDELMNEIVEAGKGDDAKAYLKEKKLPWSKLTEAQLAEVRKEVLG